MKIHDKKRLNICKDPYKKLLFMKKKQTFYIKRILVKIVIALKRFCFHV